MPAALAAMSHRAVSQAPTERSPTLRWRARMAACRSSRASGSLPISTGLRKRISAPASVSAGLVALPRNALPSMPASVLMRRRARLLLPDWFCAPEVYRVGGMSSQANKVRSMASIFMGRSPKRNLWPLLFALWIDRDHVELDARAGRGELVDAHRGAGGSPGSEIVGHHAVHVAHVGQIFRYLHHVGPGQALVVEDGLDVLHGKPGLIGDANRVRVLAELMRVLVVER